MTISWTFVLNTAKQNTADVISNKVMASFDDVLNTELELYWKDKTKYRLTFTTSWESDLGSLLHTTLHGISSDWHMIVGGTHDGLSGVTEKPRDYHLSWVSFMVMD